MRRRRQPRRWALTASVLVAALLVLAPSGPAGAVGRISAAGGYGPTWVPGRHLPVSVTVEADRLLRGELEVTLSLAGFDGSTSRARLAVEVPGGSRKTFVVVVPPVFLPEGMQAPGATLAARVVDGDGDALAESDEQGLQGGGDVDLVGILPGALTSTELPRTAPLAVDAGLARLVKLTGPQLRQAPASLDPLSTVAGGPDDLAALAPSVRQGVLRWLGDGGQLLVDAAPGTVVAGLPEAWQPGPEGFGPAGLGRVRLTGGAMAAGQWDRLVEPGTTGVAGDPTFAFFGGASSVGDSLAADAGVRRPALGWLLAFLVVYVVVVGPVTAVVLGRRRRAELAWVVVPALAVVFTGLTWVGAYQARQGTRLAHGTVIEVDELGAKETTYVGLAARTRRTATVAFPGGWTASANPSTALSRFTGRQSAASVQLTPQGPAARLELGAGQFGVASGVRASPEPEGGLDLTAVSRANGKVEGLVRNTLPYALDEAVVFVGDSGTGVGRLAAGEERPWTVLGDAGGQTGDADFWPAGSGQFGDVDHDSVVNFALWQVTGGQIGRARPDGVAMAVGWTREHRPTVLVDEAPRRPVGRTAVVARTAVEAPGPVTDMSVRGETVRGATFEAAQPTTVVRLSLPPGHQPTALLARLPAVGQAAEVWVDGRWRRLTTPAGDAAGQGSVSPPTTQPGVAVPGVAVPGVAVPGGAAPAPVPVPPPPFGFRGKADRFGPTEVYAVPAGAVRNGLVFIRMPFTGMAPGQVTQLWEAA